MKKLITKLNIGDLRDIRNLLRHKKCSNKVQLEFSYLLAKSSIQYYNVKKYPKTFKNRQICVNLIKSKLEGKEVADSVLQEASNNANVSISLKESYARFATETASLAALAAIGGATSSAYNYYATNAAANDSNAGNVFSSQESPTKYNANSTSRTKTLKELQNLLINLIIKDLGLNKEVITLLYKEGKNV